MNQRTLPPNKAVERTAAPLGGEQVRTARALASASVRVGRRSLTFVVRPLRTAP